MGRYASISALCLLLGLSSLFAETSSRDLPIFTNGRYARDYNRMVREARVGDFLIVSNGKRFKILAPAVVATHIVFFKVEDPDTGEPIGMKVPSVRLSWIPRFGFPILFYFPGLQEVIMFNKTFDGYGPLARNGVGMVRAYLERSVTFEYFLSDFLEIQSSLSEYLFHRNRYSAEERQIIDDRLVE